MKNLKLLIGGAFLSAFALDASADVQINEVMQSNVHGIMDELNEFPDSWVELHNNGADAVNLAEYALSVKDKASKAYVLPEMTLAPGAYVVVYCDKEEKGLHADFRVDSGSGYLFLWHNGEKAETVSLKKMPAPDIAWGRVTENSEEWGYQAVATPGAANCGEIVSDILPAPVFSVEGGVKAAPLTLALSLPEDAPAGAVIRFTLDGSVPSAESVAYTAPIAVSGTTVVRAALFADGYMTPLPTTQSYIFHPREQTLPIVSMTGSPEYFYDDKIGILVEGTYSEEKENFRYDWRRPVNIEYFETDGTQPINQVGETRLKGNSSRSQPLKSMVLYANKRFGTKRFSHEFFHEYKKGLTDFKSVELRNSGNDFEEIYFRDALCHRMMGRYVDLDWSDWQPAVVYINGEYKGMLNLRERSNEDYVYTNYDGLEDVDVIENWYELKEGSIDEMEKFKAFYNEEGHTYEEFTERMDIPEFFNLMITAMVFCNTDFPGNNLVLWRPTTEDGKWRWILKDFDTCLAMNPQKNNLAYLFWLFDMDYDPKQLPGNHPNATMLFRHLMATQQAQEEFLNLSAIYLGDFLQAENFNATVDAMSAIMLPEFEHHKTLYDYHWGWNDHDVLEEKIKNWHAGRVDFLYSHLSDFFKLNGPVSLQISKPETDIVITMNGVELKYENFNGKWFPGRQIRLTASRPDGAEPVGAWRVTMVSEDGTEVEGIYPIAEFTQVFPFVAGMKIEPIVGTVSVDEINVGPESVIAVEWYDLQGRCLGTHKPAAGVYIRKAGNHVTKTIIQ